MTMIVRVGHLGCERWQAAALHRERVRCLLNLLRHPEDGSITPLSVLGSMVNPRAHGDLFNASVGSVCRVHMSSQERVLRCRLHRALSTHVQLVERAQECTSGLLGRLGVQCSGFGV